MLHNQIECTFIKGQAPGKLNNGKADLWGWPSGKKFSL